MIPCICIEDNNRPKEIPESDWVKKGEPYHITFISLQVNQIENGIPVNGCDIYEKPLSIEKHNPYESFRLSRFSVTIQNLEKLIEMIEQCYQLPKEVNIEEVLKGAGLKEA
jgi:hypothetical protein